MFERRQTELSIFASCAHYKYSQVILSIYASYVHYQYTQVAYVHFQYFLFYLCIYLHTLCTVSIFVCYDHYQYVFASYTHYGIFRKSVITLPFHLAYVGTFNTVTFLVNLKRLFICFDNFFLLPLCIKLSTYVKEMVDLSRYYIYEQI
jgi:hypothetical protein